MRRTTELSPAGRDRPHHLRPVRPDGARPHEPVDVLVVDDSERIRGFVAGVLVEEGVHPTTAASSEEALDLLHDGISLVVTDVLMDGRSGVELMQELRQLRPQLPVVCMSADADLLAEASRAGADAVLPKPFSADELRIVLRLLAPR